MKEITEYRELLRDWEVTSAFLVVTIIALWFVLLTYVVLPVYYQYNMVMTAVIFIGAFVVFMFFSLLRCNELKSKIYALEQEEDETEGCVTVFAVLGDEHDRPIEEVVKEFNDLVEEHEMEWRKNRMALIEKTIILGERGIKALLREEVVEATKPKPKNNT